MAVIFWSFKFNRFLVQSVFSVVCISAVKCFLFISELFIEGVCCHIYSKDCIYSRMEKIYFLVAVVVVVCKNNC